MVTLIPMSCSQIWLSQKHSLAEKKQKAQKTVGDRTVFSEEEETPIVAHSIALSTYRFSITAFDLRFVLSHILTKLQGE